MKGHRSKRAILEIPAEIIREDKRYAATIENLSDNGMYIVTELTRSEEDFVRDTELEIRFQFPSGEKLHLHCKIRWSYVTPPHGYTFSIGLKIKDPPLSYQEELPSLR